MAADDFLFDVEEAVCLIQKEGLSFFFVHRSFQEYFTALFLSSCPENTRDDFIDKVCSRYWDNVLPMLFDMASAQLEPSWVSSHVETYLSEVGSGDGKLDPLDARFSALGVHLFNRKRVVSHFHPGKYSKFIGVMRRFYPDSFVGAKIPSWTTFEDSIEKFPEIMDVIRRDDNSVGDDHGHIIRVSIEDGARAAFDDWGLTEFCHKEYEAVARIKKSISKEQGVRSTFLENLFKKSS